MEVLGTNKFNGYVALIAANSPHALIMDWWRRLDLALREYAAALGPVFGGANGRAIEQAMPVDCPFGPRFADRVLRLRQLRNRVAHESIYHYSSEDAVAYARHAFALIGALGRTQSRVSHGLVVRNRESRHHDRAC